MPHLGHALVGAGIGAASADQPHSTLLRRTWIGGLTLVACLPDLLEWMGRWVSVTVPHNAPASPAVLLVLSALVVILLRYVFGQSGALVPAAALAALWSHALLDALDGGIPLLWPWRADDIGADLLGLEHQQGPWRLVREGAIFLPLTGLGMLVLFLKTRAPAHGRAGGVSHADPGAHGRHRDWRHPAQLLPLLPLAAFAAAEVYSHDQMRRGHQCRAQGAHAAALMHFRQARLLRPLDGDADALYWVAMSHRELGQEQEAYEIYREFLARHPRDLPMRYGLAHLLLHAREERFRRPDQGLRMLEEVYRDAPPGWYRDAIVAPALNAAREHVESLNSQKPPGAPAAHDSAGPVRPAPPEPP